MLQPVLHFIVIVCITDSHCACGLKQWMAISGMNTLVKHHTVKSTAENLQRVMNAAVQLVTST